MKTWEKRSREGKEFRIRKEKNRGNNLKKRKCKWKTDKKERGRFGDVVNK